MPPIVAGEDAAGVTQTGYERENLAIRPAEREGYAKSIKDEAARRVRLCRTGLYSAGRGAMAASRRHPSVD